MEKYKYWLFATIILQNLSGCSQHSISPDLMDKSTFTGIPCEAPCWYGLEIGKSNESEVMLVLSTLKFINQDTIRIRSELMSAWNSTELVPGVTVKADCIYPEQLCLTMIIADDKLRDIDIILNYEIRTAEVIEYLGPPDKVGVDFLSHDIIKCETKMIWLEKQIILASSIFSNSDDCNDAYETYTTGIVDSNLKIAEIYYLPPDEIELIAVNLEQYGLYRGLK